MRIEKLSDNQIRCILTSEDLAKRHMHPGELAYGSENAKSLFRDMMQQAAYQYGFEAEDYPLMIEAVPLSAGSIAVIVTKVDNPEELDTRFSNFGPTVQGSSVPEETASAETSPMEELMGAIRGSLTPVVQPDAPDLRRTREDVAQRMRDFFSANRLFSFDSMRAAVRAAKLCADGFRGKSALYYDAAKDTYYLFLTMAGQEAAKNQQNVLALLSEYGQVVPLFPARREYLKEHCETILSHNALHQLQTL
ncbi:MAG: adaptor protein MecA [Lachnospiraceae bacterium]|nr:adaptor protein MecA [Lachnospiraceae bacterium]